MENRQKIIEKLVKIKALAERGIGGKRNTKSQTQKLKRRQQFRWIFQKLT